MTRALITQAFVSMLNRNGFYIAPDAGGLTATLYQDTLVVDSVTGSPFMALKPVGKLKYTNSSVDYDLLMQLIRETA